MVPCILFFGGNFYTLHSPPTTSNPSTGLTLFHTKFMINEMASHPSCLCGWKNVHLQSATWWISNQGGDLWKQRCITDREEQHGGISQQLRHCQAHPSQGVQWLPHSPLIIFHTSCRTPNHTPDLSRQLLKLGPVLPCRYIIPLELGALFATLIYQSRH